MSIKPTPIVTPEVEWPWPLDLSAYDRRHLLTEDERVAITSAMRLRDDGSKWWLRIHHASLTRLIHPIYDAFEFMYAPAARKRLYRTGVVGILLQAMSTRGTCFWGWSSDEWVDVIGADRDAFSTRTSMGICRCLIMAFGYIATGFEDFHRCGMVFHHRLAVIVFGKPAVETAVGIARAELVEMGYADTYKIDKISNIVCKALIASRSPKLEGITVEALERIRTTARSNMVKKFVPSFSHVLAKLGIITEALNRRTGVRGPEEDAATSGVPPEWLDWCRRWVETSTLGTRNTHYYGILKVGRWVASHDLKLASPRAWGYEEAAQYVAAITRGKVGEWAARSRALKNRIGKPLKPAAIANNISSVRAFFRDCQEWGWLERRFDPGRAFRTPKSIRAQLGPDPRVIENDIWAKLLWAGLNLTQADLPVNYFQIKSGRARPFYPLEMVRAVAMVWLFAGLRTDEILRLRVGCARWQREDVVIAGTKEILSKDVVCWLDVPINKTLCAFTKPVDRPVGEAIEAWEAVRPEQAPVLDRKAREMVHYLFSFRGKRLGRAYINRHLIPRLCKKAGVPEEDARGNITSHRARSTIASQLYNSKEPLTLDELQQWLGHKYATSTQYYAKVSPTKLAKKYAEAGYFERNLRTVEVLIDREAITSGAVASGTPWQYYDLGHGWCMNAYFVECPHRMACAKCNFYLPKDSTKGLLLEGKSNLLRMRQEIPLTEDEISAVDEGVEALEKLCEKLADVPTPAGPTPRQLIQLTRSQKADS